MFAFIYLSKILNLIKVLKMFQPKDFLRNSQPTITPPQSRIVLQKFTDYSKSKWDEPFSVPSILYLKFRVQAPQNSSSQPSNSKIYPPSLIDFIKRAYDKCKDQAQNRLMEIELRNILAKYQGKFTEVEWEKFPIPILNQLKKHVYPIGTGAAHYPSISQNSAHTSLNVNKDPTFIKKQTISLPNTYTENFGFKKQEIEAPSKAKIKLSKTLQKLEEKLNKKEDQIISAQEPSKMFIGFKNQPEPRPPIVRRQITVVPTLKANEVSNTVKKIPVPPPPPSLALTKQKMLKTVTSLVPEKIFPTNKANVNAKTGVNTSNGENKNASKDRVTVTRKELSQIAKAAQSQRQLHQVAKRFTEFNKLKGDTSRHIEEFEDDFGDCDNYNIVGKNTSIDKPYLRITGRPDPQTVRPEHILRKALTHFVFQYKKGCAYDHLISQMKSIRQDLTVQHIRSSLTVQVYEENFKMSLFQNDFIQLKHCQTNLWQLYRQGIYNTLENMNKFISYQFLTLILEEKYKELQYMLTLLPEGVLQIQEIQDCLKQYFIHHVHRLKRIFLLGNYKAFFDFYSTRDTVSRCLLNMYIDKIRVKCLVMVSKTFGEKIKFSVLAETLGEDQDVLEALAKSEGGVVREECLILKESYEKLSQSQFLVTKKVTALLS